MACMGFVSLEEPSHTQTAPVAAAHWHRHVHASANRDKRVISTICTVWHSQIRHPEYHANSARLALVIPTLAAHSFMSKLMSIQNLVPTVASRPNPKTLQLHSRASADLNTAP